MLLRSLGLVLAVGSLFLACGGGDDSSGTGGKGGKGGSSGKGGSGGSGGSGATDSGSGGTAATGGGGAAGAGNCGNYGQVAACQDCLKTKCCQQAGACAANADCDGLITCARACPNPADTTSACFQTCAQQHNAGGGFFNPLAVCLSNSCSSSCSFP